jgi:hypothetical protein
LHHIILATKTVNAWTAVLGTVKNRSFRVRIVASPNGSRSIMIGMAPAHINRESSNYNSCGYYLYANTGGLYSGAGDGNRSYTSAVPVGSVVSVLLDRAQRTISFAWRTAMC